MTVLQHAHTLSAASPETRETAPAGTRERILTASYGLFARRGIRDVSIDEIIALSGVAKATLYRHFPSKDDLVLAFLERREQQWTFGTMAAGAQSRADNPEGQLLAIFDVFDEWFHQPDFEACSFVNVLLELGPNHPAGKASVQHLANIRLFVQQLAVAAGIPDAHEFALSWHILMKGSIVEAAEGDPLAARRAQRMARMLITHYRSSDAA